MYLSNLKLWNFRKFGSDSDFSLDEPNLDLNFNRGLNVLVGENDSGKTAIIDAIKLVLKTHSYEWIRTTSDDFYNNKDRFRIELVFSDFTDEEAKNFPEWIGWTGSGEEAKPYLRLIYDVKRDIEDDRIFPSDVKAGVDDSGYELTAEAREYLKVTYLRPLRDAQNELIPKQNSRLSQILKGHEAFKGKEDTHYLVGLLKTMNESIEKYFLGKDEDDKDLTADLKGKELKDEIDTFIEELYDKTKESNFSVVKGKLKNILEKLELSLGDEINPGLGTLNRLFMSAELLHLRKKNWDGVRLGLIEELEAHLHPQAQMRVIESLQEKTDIQLIVTTHSPNIGSKLKLENLMICCNAHAFPMGSEYTELEKTDYSFLERFLDTTKANLFFARGVILVEGWAEEMILPALSRKLKSLGIIENDLTEAGVSVVNIGNTAFLRYGNIFKRKGGPELSIPVAIITDLDIRPADFSQTDDFIDKLKKSLERTRGENYDGFDEDEAKKAFYRRNKITTEFDSEKEKRSKEDKYSGQSVKVFVSPFWTLEYCIGLSEKLAPILFEAIKQAGQEMTDDGQPGKTVTEDWDAFSNSKTQEQIAFGLYHEFIGDGKNISKSIIAQRFTILFERDTSITKEDLEQDKNISYLIKAVKYAST